MKRIIFAILDFVMCTIGLGYKVNHGTKEIHNLRKKHPNCKTHMISHWEYVDNNDALELLNKGYNGCRWCCPQWDKG